MENSDNDLVLQFKQDRHGRTFTDVLNDPRIDNFHAVLAFFADEKRQEQLVHSELGHLRPALAGVVVELEKLPVVANFLGGYDGHTTMRFRQAVGVIVRIIMENRGYQPAHRKGSLGTRAKISPGSTAPGAYQNKGGLSRWFVRAEHYIPKP